MHAEAIKSVIVSIATGEPIFFFSFPIRLLRVSNWCRTLSAHAAGAGQSTSVREWKQQRLSTLYGFGVPLCLIWKSTSICHYNGPSLFHRTKAYVCQQCDIDLSRSGPRSRHLRLHPSSLCVVRYQSYNGISGCRRSRAHIRKCAFIHEHNSIESYTASPSHQQWSRRTQHSLRSRSQYN